MRLRKSSTFQVMMMFALIAGGIVVSDLGSSNVSKGEAEYGLENLQNMQAPYYKTDYKTDEKIIEKPVGNTEVVEETTGVPSYRVEEEVTQEPITNNGSNYNAEPERTDGLSSRITTVTESGQAPSYYSNTSTTTTTRTTNSSTLPTTSGSNIRIFVDGRAIQFTDAYPFIDSNNRTLVPVRVVSENLGMTVTWDPNARRVGINNTMFLTIDSKYASVNGRTVEMDTKAIIVGGRTYVPLRFVSENFGVDVDWARNNLGGIDVFLNSGGTQPTPGKIPVASDFAHLEATLPQTLQTELSGGAQVLTKDFVLSYIKIVLDSAVLVDNAIYFYLPKVPTQCFWDSNRVRVEFVNGSAMSGHYAPATRGGFVQKVEIHPNALNQDWSRLLVGFEILCEGVAVNTSSAYIKHFVDNYEWIYINYGMVKIYEQYK